VKQKASRFRLPSASDPIAGILKATGDPTIHLAFAIMYWWIWWTEPSDKY